MQHILVLLTQDTPAPASSSLPESMGTSLLFLVVGLVAVRVAWRFVGGWFPPRPRPVVPLGFWNVVEVGLVFLLGGMLASLVFGGQWGTSSSSGPERPLDVRQAVIVQILATALAGSYAIWVTRRSGGHWRDLGLHFDALPRTFAFAILLYVTFLPIVFGCEGIRQALAQWILGHAPDTQRIVKELSERHEVRSSLTFVLAIALVVPFLEELLFRGFLYTVLRRPLSAAAAISVDAILFGVTHDAGVSAVVLLGGLLAFLFERTRSLFACTLVHMLHNSYTLLIIFGQQGA